MPNIGDLWGPLLLCLLLCTTLSIRTEGDTKTIITSIFVIMWVGSLIVFVNANFLGSEMTFFQAASLLGYCLFPINVASFAMVFVQGWFPAIFKLAVVGASFLWASTCKYGYRQALSHLLVRWYLRGRESWPSTRSSCFTSFWAGSSW